MKTDVAVAWSHEILCDDEGLEAGWRVKWRCEYFGASGWGIEGS